MLYHLLVYCELSKANLDDRFSKETEELVESHFVKTQASRNAQLARLRNYTSENSGEAQEKRASGLLFACRQHFEAAATKRCCYDDLRECIHALEVEDRQSFLDFTNETSEGIRVINQPDKVGLIAVFFRYVL